MRTSNEDELRNLIITLEVATTFTRIANKNIKRKLKISKLLKISISLDASVAPTKSVIKQLNKKSCLKNFLLSRLFLRSQNSASEITKANVKITLLQKTKITSIQETSIKKKL